ncbi:CS1 type fimbrial major subunit, partial [Staphylococcus aureus]
LYSNDQTKSVNVKLLNAPQLINVLDPTKTIDMEVTLGGRSLTTTNSVLEAKTLFPDGKTGDASALLNLDIGQKAGAALQNLPAGEYSGLVSLVISQAVTAG